MERKMEDELRIYESNVKAFEDYCAERKLSCMLQVEAYPLSVTVYQSGDSRQIRGQLSMEEEPQRPIPSCTWTFVGGQIICHTANDWAIDEKTMNRLKNHAKKIVIAFLHQFFAKSMLGEE